MNLPPSAVISVFYGGEKFGPLALAWLLFVLRRHLLQRHNIVNAFEKIRIAQIRILNQRLQIDFPFLLLRIVTIRTIRFEKGGLLKFGSGEHH